MSSLFGGGGTTVVQAPTPATPAAPTPLPPPTMPDPMAPANIAAGAQKAQQDAMRAGRMSNILTTTANRPSTIAGGSLGAAKSSAGTPAPVYTNTSL